jgi:hypothetical protein
MLFGIALRLLENILQLRRRHGRYAPALVIRAVATQETFTERALCCINALFGGSCSLPGTSI